MGYYEDLGVSRDTSCDDIKRAYRKLAKKYHPDVNSSKDAVDNFKKISAAYEVLGDEKRKRIYDAECNNHFNLNNIFNNNSINRSRVNKHKTKKKFEKEANTTISVSFKEAILGVQNKTIINTYKKECSICYGYGGEYTKCVYCHGIGMINKVDGFISMNITCHNCKGDGKILDVGCLNCNSNGCTEHTEEIIINIPEGLEQRTKLLSKGKGNFINNSRGNLFINIEIEPEKPYHRSGNDITMDVPVNVFDILLEKTITIDYFKEIFLIDLLDIDIKEHIIKKGFGTKTVNGNNYGDLIVKLNVIIPKITDIQKKNINILMSGNELKI